LPLHPSYRSDQTTTQHEMRSHRARGHWQDAKGFTLIELLVVVLIISILTAIAIPLFEAPQEHAVAASAKSLVGNAATAVAAYAADNSGSYEGLTRGTLHAQEPDIDVTQSSSDPYISRAEGTNTDYKITATAPNGDEFTIADRAGAMTRTCVSTLSQTGCDGAQKSSW
jgi:prepilin-type N-terminal cleavage/methylation domain-containing protein